MALLFFDGFDYSTSTASLASKWKGVIGSSLTINSTGGRNGKGTISSTNNAGYTPVYRPATTNGTYIVGFAVKFASFSSGYGSSIVSIYGTTTDPHAYLGTNGSGDLILYRNEPSSFPTTLATISGVFTTGVWYHIEWKYTPSASCATDSNIIKVNNAVVLNLTATTRTTSLGAYVNNGIQIGQRVYFSSTYSAIFDDFWAIDISGSSLNDFLGDCYIDYQKPNGVGYYNQFSPTGAATNWQAAVDDNGDTSYCSSDQNYHQSFQTDEISASISTIYAMQLCSIIRKEGAGSHTMKNLFRISSADYEGTANNLGSGYAQIVDASTLNPATGIPWVQADLPSLEIGIRITA